jgi:hypothetical protein
MIRYLVLLALAIGLVGCGHVRPKANFSKFGEADPDKEEKVMENYKQVVSDDKHEPKKDIVVLIDTIPEGLDLKEGNIAVQSGYSHQLIGKFTLDPEGQKPPLSFMDYRDDWRKPYCYWQVPLGWVTLTLWTTLIPLAYPCWSDLDNTKGDIISDIKNMTEAAGGDLAIAGFMYPHEKYVWGASGYIIKLDPKLKGKELKTKKQELSTKEKKL